jgi:hypothetical protein
MSDMRAFVNVVQVPLLSLAHWCCETLVYTISLFPSAEIIIKPSSGSKSNEIIRGGKVCCANRLRQVRKLLTKLRLSFNLLELRGLQALSTCGLLLQLIDCLELE